MNKNDNALFRSVYILLGFYYDSNWKLGSPRSSLDFLDFLGFPNANHYMERVGMTTNYLEVYSFYYDSIKFFFLKLGSPRSSYDFL